MTSKPERETATTVPASLKAFFQVLKKIKLKHNIDREKDEICLKTIAHGLKYAEVDEFIKSHIMEALRLSKWPNRASVDEINQLSAFQTKNFKMRLSNESKQFFNSLAQVVNSKNFIPDNIQPFSKSLFLKSTFKQINDELLIKHPYIQHSCLNQIALNLAKQIAANKGPTSLFLHGTSHSGIGDIVNTLVELFKSNGYAHENIRCEQYQGEQDEGTWSGWDTVYSGSRPGIVTKQLYDFPKSVVVYNNLSISHPKVGECLIQAFEKGYITDKFGLDKPINDIDRKQIRVPTKVSTDNAIFIFTDYVAGEEIYQSPVLLKRLEDNPSLVYETLKNHTSISYGKEYLTYSPVLLEHISKHLVSVLPVSFKDKITHQKASLKKALKSLESDLEVEIKCKQTDMDAITKFSLLNHNLNKLPATVVIDHLVNIQPQLMTNQFKYKQLNLSVSDLAKQQLNDLLKELEIHAHPQLAMEKQSRTIEASSQLLKDTLTITSIKIKSINQVKDFTDEVKFQAEYPQGVTLEGLIGHEQVKSFLLKMIGYLQAPAYLEENNIALPKGVLLYGPPGTGKTHIAQCFASQAKLPLIATTGPDLLRPNYIGSLFKLVNKHSPCVVFIDEASALCNRSTSEVHAIAINKLLAEIQGFEKSGHVFFILACNQPEKLDPALLRSGRIDRKFFIGPLNEGSRRTLMRDIEKYCVSDIDWKKLNNLSEGFTGAQIKQLIRECGLCYLDKNQALTFESVRDLIVGIQHGSIESTLQADANIENAQRVAVHELGHALVQHLLFVDEKIKVISIKSTANFGGYIQVQQHNQDITKKMIKNKLAVLMAGRVAEVVMYGEDEISVGSTSDLKNATELAWEALTKEGFSNIGLMAFDPSDMPDTLKMQYINTVKQWLDEAANQARKLIEQHKNCLSEIANVLIEKKIIDGEEFAQLLHQQINRNNSHQSEDNHYEKAA